MVQGILIHTLELFVTFGIDIGLAVRPFFFQFFHKTVALPLQFPPPLRGVRFFWGCSRIIFHKIVIRDGPIAILQSQYVAYELLRPGLFTIFDRLVTNPLMIPKQRSVEYTRILIAEVIGTF